jgi:hypothetical protein
MAIVTSYDAIPDVLSDYVFDVFVSYKRDPQIEDWMNRTLQIVDRELSQAMGGSCTIFFDRATIPVGANWQDVLRRGVRASRCVFAFWSPAYFTASEWCPTEWHSFKEREAQLGLQDGWISFPVRRDRGPLPDAFSTIQLPDLSRYSSSMPAFWNSERAVDLEDALKDLIDALASRVARAPQFQPEFPFSLRPPYPRPPYQPRFSGTAN